MNDLNKLMEEFDKAQSFHDKMMVFTRIMKLGSDAKEFVKKEPEFNKIVLRLSEFAKETNTRLVGLSNLDNRLSIAFENPTTDSWIELLFFDKLDKDFEKMVYDTDFNQIGWPEKDVMKRITIYSKDYWTAVNENNNG